MIAALGGDPQAVSDMAGEKTINLFADGTYNRGKTEPLDTQGTNALIWALIALIPGIMKCRKMHTRAGKRSWQNF